jgi:hypothetical protein
MVVFEDSGLVKCGVASLVGVFATFQKNMLPPSLG